MSNNNSGSGQRDGLHRTEDGSMSDFDSLPPDLRRMLAQAPFNYSPANVAKRLRQYEEDPSLGKGISDLLAEAERGIRDHIRQAALNLYGPDHPQAMAKESKS